MTIELDKDYTDQHYTAMFEDCFPCNPIPFANKLAEHVRENGTDSIKSDEAKQLLYILMAQAYGQLAVISLCDEWDRLYLLQEEDSK